MYRVLRRVPDQHTSERRTIVNGIREKTHKKALRRKDKRKRNRRKKLVTCQNCSKSHPHGKDHKCGTSKKLAPRRSKGGGIDRKALPDASDHSQTFESIEVGEV